MTSGTWRRTSGQKLPPAPGRFSRVRLRMTWLAWQERVGVAGMLLLAGVLRFVLAARGWPSPNSDEATIGLMVDDILWHGAHPAFTYGEHHVGSLDAYLQAPFFAVLGPTRFALHVTTTLQFLAFLLVLYALTRAVFSKRTAMVTLALLVLGADLALYFELRAGHYAQDMLLLGALLMWLVVVRLGGALSRWRRPAVDLSIGLVAGLALWSTILLAPFVGAAILALGVEALRRWRVLPSGQRVRVVARQIALPVVGALIGFAPFLVVTVSTHGAVLREALRAAGATGGPPAPSGPLGGVISLGQQLAGTLLFGLPSLFGSRTACVGCPVWPSPYSEPSPWQALHVALIGAFYSGLFLFCWWRVAYPLGRAAWSALRGQWSSGHTATVLNGPHQPSWWGWQRFATFAVRLASARSSGTADAPAAHVDGIVTPDREAVARRWGRAMLVIGGGGALLQYVLARTSYDNVDTAPRYITDLYLCTPLIADALALGAHEVRRWLTAHRRHLTSIHLPSWRALLATAALLALVAVNALGAATALAESGNRQVYGVPAGQRDMQLLTFLQAHHATRFYTTWWVCYRLMFDARENVSCYIISDSSIAQPGFNRVPAYAAQVLAAPHPAYVFDLTTSEVDPSVPKQIASDIARGEPRFAGYTSAVVGGYVVFYDAHG